MSWMDFALVCVCCVATMLVCRVVPVFALRGRTLPARAVRALKLIPQATFAALIANDLFKPGMFDAGLWPACAPLVVAALVFFVGHKTKSLLWCIIVGVGAYTLAMFI